MDKVIGLLFGPARIWVEVRTRLRERALRAGFGLESWSPVKLATRLPVESGQYGLFELQ